MLIKWTLYSSAVYLSSFAFPNAFRTQQAVLAKFDRWIEEVPNSYSAVGDLHEARKYQQMPLLRERLQQGISSSLLSWVREDTYGSEQGIAHTAFCPYDSSEEDESMYAGSRKAGNTGRGRNILVEGSEEVQLLNLGGFLKCLYFYWQKVGM